jgi:hypothetical protein
MIAKIILEIMKIQPHQIINIISGLLKGNNVVLNKNSCRFLYLTLLPWPPVMKDRRKSYSIPMRYAEIHPKTLFNRFWPRDLYQWRSTEAPTDHLLAEQSGVHAIPTTPLWLGRRWLVETEWQRR